MTPGLQLPAPRTESLVAMPLKLAAGQRPRPGIADVALISLMLLGFAVGVLTMPDPAAAQRQREYASIDSLRHIQSVEPRMGPPGTAVEIYTENLPPQARIHVGVGAMRAGFEALAEGTQQIWGEVSATVTVPAYATSERPLVFILFNGIFSPIGISHPFHVTDDEGMVQRTGRMTDEGLECPTMRDNDQYMYALSGDLGGLDPGDEVTVRGRIALSGPCGEVDTIEVVEWLAG